jgi:hypothetical protein
METEEVVILREQDAPFLLRFLQMLLVGGSSHSRFHNRQHIHAALA